MRGLIFGVILLAIAVGLLAAWWATYGSLGYRDAKHRKAVARRERERQAQIEEDQAWQQLLDVQNEQHREDKEPEG